MKDIKKHQKQLQLKAKKDAEKAKQRQEEPTALSHTEVKQKSGNVSLAKQMMDLFTPKPVDFDPADNEVGHFSTKKSFLQQQEELLENDEDGFGGEIAPKIGSLQAAPESKLRLRGDIALFDGKYAGVKSSRKQLNDFEDDDDEDGYIEDEDIDNGDDGEDIEDDEADIGDIEDELGQQGEDHDQSSDENDNIDGDNDEAGDEEEGDDGIDGKWSSSEEGYSEDGNDDTIRGEDDADEGFSNFMNSNNEALQMIEKELEEEEKKAVDTFQKGASRDVEKASHVRNQMALWDQFIDVRIRLQKALALANKLPKNTTFSSFVTESTDERVSQLSDLAIQETGALLDSLLECKQVLCESNEQIPNWNRKRTLETPKHDIESHWTDVVAADTSFEGFMNDSIDRWNRKTQLFTGDLTGKKLKSMNQSILKQVEHVLADEGRLKKRTQLKRSSYHIIGELDTNVARKEEADYDEEIFDDTDFYSQILKELIERKTGADSSDPIALSRQYLAMIQAKGKLRKKVDQRASKGRKIRFTVHEKLVSFMAPLNREYPPVLDDLCSNLFGRNA